MENRKDFPVYLLGLALLLFVPGLGARDFWAPVEPRYAEIVRVMFAKGEWVVPTVNGELYTDKPILYFWLVLIASKLVGVVNEWTVRLPAAMGGVGLVLATYFIGREFFTARVGFYGAAILATCMRVIWEARWAHIDALFCCFFAFSIYFGARSLFKKGHPNEILIAYVFMGLAVLAKGLIGIVLPGLIFLAFVLTQRDWRMIGGAKLHLGIPIFLIVTGPWFYLVNRATDGKWLADFIYVHHVRRYTDGEGHVRPFYYYFETLPADFLPWTVFAIPAVFARCSFRDAWSEPAAKFFLLWFLSIFVFFTLSDTKRDLYLMPLLPPLALFVGNYFNDLATARLPQDALYRWLTTVYFGLLGLAGLALPIAVRFYRPDFFGAALPASTVLGVGSVFVLRFIRRGRPLAVLASVSALMMATLFAVWLSVFPYLECFKSPRIFAAKVHEIVSPASPLFIYADAMHDFNYYLEREVIPILLSPGDVDAWLARGEHGYIMVTERNLRRVPSLSREWIRATGAKEGNSTLHLLELNPPSSP